MSIEWMKIFISEALHRSRQVADEQNSVEILPEHLEQVLAQLLLDF
jgi:hypothetical protein